MALRKASCSAGESFSSTRATFTAEGVQPADGGVRVTGTLTIRGQGHPLSFDAQVSSADGEVSLDAAVPFNRADLGMTWNMMGMAPMKSTIVIHAVFTRQ